MKMKETILRTEGNSSRPRYSYRDIWKIAFPLVLSSVVEQLVGMTDTAFLGRVGEVESDQELETGRVDEEHTRSTRPGSEPRGHQDRYVL